MNTVGVFAGRGDVILGMTMAMVVGGMLGWYAKKFKDYLVGKFKAT